MKAILYLFILSISSISKAGLWYAEPGSSGKKATCSFVDSAETVLKTAESQTKAKCQLNETMIPTALNFSCPGKGDLIFFRSKDHCDKFSSALINKQKITALEFYPPEIVQQPDRIALFSKSLVKCVSKRLLPNATYGQELKYCDCYAKDTSLLPANELIQSLSNRMPAEIPNIIKKCKYLAR